jgi:mediator of RNA polymerase II transcription subunit 24
MSKITDPQSKALAKLSIFAILATMENVETSPQKKRPRSTEDEDLSPAAKMRKTGLDQSVSIDASQSDKDTSSQQLKESLRISLLELFKVFHQQVVTDDELSPKVNFIFQFFSLLVQFEKSVKIKAILKLIPNGLVMNLLKLVHHEDLTYGFILRFERILFSLFFLSNRLK